MKSVPIIVINGDKIITIEVGDTYEDPGATATYKDTDITSSIVTTGTVDTSKEGTYTIKYNVTYNGKNAEEGTRKVTVKDMRPTIASTTTPNPNGWYKENININITSSTDTSGIKEIKYCKTTSTSCSPDTTISGTSGSITIDTENETNYVCALTVDKAGNQSETKCSGPYALDKTAPTLTILADTSIPTTAATTYDILDGVSATDSLSGIDGSITTSGDLSAIVGDYTITYTVTDKAGNTTTGTRKITVKVAGVSFTEKMQNSSEVAALDPDGNLRYVGSDPDNYVWFNNELWRIIGVFDGQAKIIKDDYYNTAIMWDDNSDGSYSNNWATASLQLALNNTTDGYIKTIQTNDPTSYGYIDLEHVWNIGAYDSSYETTGTRSAFYSAERSKTPAANGSDSTWTGAIGLMYPSDYGYASSGSTETCNNTVMLDWNSGTAKTECVEKSWLYDQNYQQWTLTTNTKFESDAFLVVYAGYVGSHDVDDDYDNAARPVLFLKSNVVIVDGTGDSQDPYKLAQ